MKITDEKIQEIIKNRPTWVTTHEVSMAQEIFYARAEIERLRARVGWLDHLDTEEGRHAHANEALLVENEQLKASLKEASKLLGGLASVCNYAHHSKHDRHSLAEQCPVEKRIDDLLAKINK